MSPNKRIRSDQLPFVSWHRFPPVPFVRRTYVLFFIGSSLRAKPFSVFLVSSAIKERTIPFTTQTGDMASITIPIGTTLFLGIAGANRLESVWGVRLLFTRFRQFNVHLKLMGIGRQLVDVCALLRKTRKNGTLSAG